MTEMSMKNMIVENMKTGIVAMDIDHVQIHMIV